MRIAPFALTWYCWTLCPVSHTALPDVDIDVKIERLFCDIIRSPSRPPQPTVAPSGLKDIQVFDWSLCENSIAGRRPVPLLYVALVSGSISGPTLETIAS